MPEPLGSPGPGAGGIGGSSLGARIKVDSSDLKSMLALWKQNTTAVNAYTAALKKATAASSGFGGGGAGGGGGGGAGTHGGDNRSPNMPALPSGYQGHLVGTGGGGSGGGGGGLATRGGLVPSGGGGGYSTTAYPRNGTSPDGGGGFKALAAGAIIGSKAIGRGISGNLDDILAGSQIYRNMAIGSGGTMSNQASRQFLFGGGNQNGIGGFSNFSDFQQGYTTLANANGPGFGGSARGQSALSAAGRVGNLTGSFQQGANVVTNLQAPQTFYKAAMVGINMNQLQTDPEGFAKAILTRLYGGKMPTSANIEAGLRPGGRLRFSLTNLGLDDDTINFIAQYGEAQSTATAKGQGSISLAQGSNHQVVNTAANRAAGVGTNQFSKAMAAGNASTGIMQTLGAKSPLAGYFTGIATAGTGLIGALNSFIGSIAGYAGVGGMGLNALGIGGGGGRGSSGLLGGIGGTLLTGALLRGGMGMAGRAAAAAGGLFGGAGGAGAGGAAAAGYGFDAAGNLVPLAAGGAAAAAGRGAMGLLGKAGVVGAAATGIYQTGKSLYTSGRDLLHGHYADAAGEFLKNNPFSPFKWSGLGNSANDVVHGKFGKAVGDLPGAGLVKGLGKLLGFGGTSNASSMAISMSGMAARSGSPTTRRGTGGPSKSLRVVRPVPFPVSQAYGHNGHPGTDYAADPGSTCGHSILACEDGTVLLAGPAQGFGNWIVIQHPDGYYTVYGHMYDAGVLARAGQQVKAGQTIGLVGSNGDSTGCHLHLEVHNGWPGVRQDPEAWLKGHGAATVSGSAASDAGKGDTSGSAASGTTGKSSAGTSVNAPPGNYGSVEEIDVLSGALSGYNASSAGSSSSSSSSSKSGSASSSSTTASSAAAPGNPTGNTKLAQQMAAKRGWTGAEWNALYALWTQESGFNEKAKNPSSGAYGIPQSLPANKMASAGADYLTNPATQIQWGLDYIAGRYKDPVGAEAHEKAMNWYREGAWNAKEGLAYLHGGEIVVNNNQASQMRKAVQRARTAGTGTATGGSAASTRVSSPAAIHFNITAPIQMAGGPQDARAFWETVKQVINDDDEVKGLSFDIAGMSS